MRVEEVVNSAITELDGSEVVQKNIPNQAKNKILANEEVIEDSLAENSASKLT